MERFPTLVFIYLILVYLFGLLWLALCDCFNLINEHDVNLCGTMMLFPMMIL
jgi:hypothetical protein